MFKNKSGEIVNEKKQRKKKSKSKMKSHKFINIDARAFNSVVQ